VISVTSPSENNQQAATMDAVAAEAAPQEDERPSITGMHGASRFDMSYSLNAGDRLMFGPPLRMRLPSFIYLGLSVAALGLVLAAYTLSSNSKLYIWLIEGDKSRPLSSLAFALILLVSAIGTVIRAHMRGVVVQVDGIEARYLLALGIPRIRKWAWAQVSRLIVDDAAVMLELWDGSYARLPEVAKPRELGDLLERLGASRGIQVTRLKNSLPRRG
jgi:hypothetical protein